ncbi:hypothetical protein Tco_1210516 [Tanacetum coccineum]
MTEEETQASRKTKEQILQEEAGLAEAIRLDALEKALEKEEVAKQVHLDSLLSRALTKTAKKLKVLMMKVLNQQRRRLKKTKMTSQPSKIDKEKKLIARKGFHTILDRDESEDSDKAKEKDDSTSEIYRIVMMNHGMNEPEDEFEKVLWEYLKNMFEEPLNTDSIWSLPGQQRIICWRYYDACRVHCLNLESVDVYIANKEKESLLLKVCLAMLDKKLLRTKTS